MGGNHTDLLNFQGGTITGVYYCTEVLLPYVRLSSDSMGSRFVFVRDSVIIHNTVTFVELLESGDIHRIDWLAMSPDLNATKHLWNILGRHLVSRHQLPKAIPYLRFAPQEEWAAIPQQVIYNLGLSM